MTARNLGPPNEGAASAGGPLRSDTQDATPTKGHTSSPSLRRALRAAGDNAPADTPGRLAVMTGCPAGCEANRLNRAGHQPPCTVGRDIDDSAE